SLALAMVITAFEWTTVKLKGNGCHLPSPPTDDMTILPEVLPINYPQPKTVSIEKSKPKENPIQATIIDAITDTEKEQDVPLDFDWEKYINETELAVGSNPLEEVDDFPIFPERNAEPVGGYKKFYEEIGDNIKYPTQAKRLAIEGKVFVQFIIDRLGQPNDFKILRGIGGGCDEEAIRVLSKTKWEPARQRGVPVKVRMVLPIIFKLTN
ncbi:MAG: energy transducer TonB, partial [Bacteroidota bacterium]